MVDWSRGDAELFRDLFMLDGANKLALGDLWEDVTCHISEWVCYNVMPPYIERT